ncbi:ATP-binding protein [Streptomyces violaceus]|uniref:ATP-binding protein n=1 Tax=Streptomyces violaceus TaxID=1936 RepID=UPI0039A664FB
MRFSSTRRGARLARRMAEHVLDAWGVPYDSEPHDALTLVVAELCANAVRHGRVQGRDFELRLTADRGPRTVRVEVTDTVGERVPILRRPAAEGDGPAAEGDGPAAEGDGPAESGRGLLLVAGLADDWGWHPRVDGPGKTVWAQYTLRTRGVPGSGGPGSHGAGATTPEPRDAAVTGVAPSADGRRTPG